MIDSLLFSLKIGVGSAFGSLIFSYPLALFLREYFLGRNQLRSLIKIPLFVPALVAAFLIINIISYHGIINEVLIRIGIIQEPLSMLRDKWGLVVLFIQIWKNVPFQMLIISAALETVRKDIIDAAKNLGANQFVVLRDITIPLTMPGILVAVILVFIRGFGDYMVTKSAGPTYPSSLAVRMHTNALLFQEWNRSACIGIIIITVAILFVVFYSKLAKLIQK